MVRFLRWGEFPTRGFFLGWTIVIPSHVDPWKPISSIETTPGWEV